MSGQQKTFAELFDKVNAARAQPHFTQTSQNIYYECFHILAENEIT